MKETILIAGGTGLIGKRLIQLIDKDHYEIKVLSRSKRVSDENVTYYQWDTNNNFIEEGAFPADHIINLSGAGIAEKRWTKTRKKHLIESRVKSVELLGSYLKKNDHRLKTWIGASAIGFYGHRPSGTMKEDDQAGEGFLSDCCEKWETASESIIPLTSRMVTLRIGIVLSMNGGALPKMLMTAKTGILNYFGSGKQVYSWIHIDDLCKMFIHALKDDKINGIYNAVGPGPLSNKDMMKAIKKVLHPKTLLLPVPGIILRTTLGEMAHVVLDSAKVSSSKIEQTGFTFDYGNIEKAFTDLSKRRV